MILVKNPGSWSHTCSPLKHAEWNGLTATDLVFPFFLSIVGVAMPFSFEKRIQAGASLLSLFLRHDGALVLFCGGSHDDRCFAVNDVPGAGPQERLLFFALAYVALWCVLFLPLYRRKVFIRI